MNHLISARTGYFPAKTFSGTGWFLQSLREDGWTNLTVTGLSAIPVAEWLSPGLRPYGPRLRYLRRAVCREWLDGVRVCISLDRTV